MTRLSLQAHVAVGALLWTIGLVILASAGLVAAIETHSGVRAFLGVHDFFKQPLVLITAALSMAAGVLQVRRGLAPLRRLRTRLAGVHAGRDPRVEGVYPAEVQPLVNDLNVLLEHRAHAVRRAIAKAGDLAHGLKTPLALLVQEAERARAAGHEELAAAVLVQVERMRRQVDYHLAHARAAASGASPGARTPIRAAADGLAFALTRLYVDRGLDIEVQIADDLTARVQREDLEEMLGNLLDNACKWGRTRVRVAAAAVDGVVEITVDDDGPGLPAEMREAVLQRGVRADEAAPGSGLGLAIVRDLAEVYGGGVSLQASPDGGVRAILRLPA